MEFSYIGVFGAGLITFVSPCVLPMVPIIAANYLMAQSSSTFAKLKATLLFSAGFMLTFTLMGLSLPLVSSLLGESKDWLLILSGLILLVYGLKMSGLISLQDLRDRRYFSWLDRSFQFPNIEKYFPKSVHGFLFGATFGLAWTPCVGPILGGVLTYVATEERSIVESVLLMLSFASGIVAPFIALAFGGDLIQKRLNRLKPMLPKIEEYTGYGLILIAGLILFQAQLPTFNQNKLEVDELSVQIGEQATRLSELAPDSHKLLFFTSEYCPICQQMEEFMPALEKECQGEHFQIVRIDVNKLGNSKISEYFRVKATPTMSLLTKQNTEVAYTVGYQSELNLRRAMSLIPGLNCNTESPKVAEPVYKEGEACDPDSGGLTC